MLPHIINTAIDGLLLIALIVIAVVVGKPLSYLNCRVIGSSSVAQSAYQLGTELKASLQHEGGQVVYSNWIGANKSTCYEMKAIWGLSIALWYVLTVNHFRPLYSRDHSILFAFSAICSVCLWRRSKQAPKDVEG